MEKNIINTLASQNIEFTQKLIDEGLNLSDINLSEIMAKILNNEEIELNQNYLKFLIQNGIELNSQTKNGYSPLMMSIIKNLDEITYLLLEKDVDIHKVNSKGMNAILWAVSLGKYDLVRNLFDRGADIYQKIYLEIVEYNEFGIISMKDGKRTIKSHNISAFALAFNNYNKNVVRFLLELGFDPNENVSEKDKLFSVLTLNKDFINTWIIEKISMDYVVKENDTETFHLLIEKGFNRFNSESLYYACENLNFEMIKVLVEKGVDVNESNFFYLSALSKICEYGSIGLVNDNCSLNSNVHSSEILKIVSYLIENGADVNLDSPLMSLISVKKETEDYHAKVNLDIVNILIQHGADVNFVDKNDSSILIKSLERINSFEIIDTLIENGADFNYKDKDGNTILMKLKDHGYNEFEYDEDENGKWSSFESKEFPSEKILYLLIEKGININSRNNMGLTALMKYAYEGKNRLVKILLENGADINVKSEMTAFDLAQTDEIKELIQKSKNNHPQKLVKILTNFTIDKPIKYTTHTWDFGELKKEYGNFDGYMNAVKKQFDTLKYELEELSPNLYKKIYTFLLETTPDEKYSWCSKTNINIGWSSLDGLKEWCDSGKNPFDFKLQKPIIIPPRKQISTFEEVINLFKQEIEIRSDFKNLETIFNFQKNKLDSNFKLDLSNSKLSRQFYTDTQRISFALDKIFAEIGKRKEFLNLEVNSIELDDRSIEIAITQIDSRSNRSENELLERAKQSGDLADIVEILKNLCDYSIESSHENTHFRVNFLHSNNVRDIEILSEKPKGFSHILRFYK